MRPRCRGDREAAPPDRLSLRRLQGGLQAKPQLAIRVLGQEGTSRFPLVDGRFARVCSPSWNGVDSELVLHPAIGNARRQSHGRGDPGQACHARNQPVPSRRRALRARLLSFLERGSFRTGSPPRNWECEKTKSWPGGPRPTLPRWSTTLPYAGRCEAPNSRAGPYGRAGDCCCC